MRIHVLRLQPGDDLRAVLAAQPFAAACVVSAVGSFTQAVLRYAAQAQGTPIEGPLELIALAGTLGAGGVHLHAIVSDAQGNVRGGHVMPGCSVRTTAEVVLAELEGWSFGREPDAATGYLELVPVKRPAP